MSDQATYTAPPPTSATTESRVAYEPDWYARLLAFAQSIEDVGDPLVVE
jgi:hypothetical protein